MEFQAKTVEEAVESGLKELGLAREDAEIVVLEEGKKGGLFGIGHVDARVEITAKAKLSDGERAVKFLEGLFPLLDWDCACKLTGEEEKITIEIKTDATRGIIGRRGEVIDAVQTLAGAVANIGRKDYKRVVVDCENYREEREETLKRLAEKLAAKAVRLGKRVRLEPMNPYERRIIHSALLENEEVTTKSEGKEPARYVVITPKNLRERRGGRGQGSNNRDNRQGRGRYDGRQGRGRSNVRGDKYGDREKKYRQREIPEGDTPQTSGTSFTRSGTPGYRKGGFSGFFGTYLGKAEETTKPDLPETEAPEKEDE